MHEALRMADAICRNAAKALRATGVEQLLLDQDFGDGITCGEACDVARELRWRLRNLARNLQMRMTTQQGSAVEMALLQPLFALLEGEEEVAV